MRIVFMGTPEAAVPSLERLLADGNEVVAVYTQPDRPAGRGNKLTPPPVKVFAESKRLRVLQPTKIRTEEAAQEFKAHEADVAVVVAYGRILPEELLNAYPHGAINLHFSLLPKYRGAAPVNWAIANGETVTGVTTMKMDAGLDTGGILLQESVEIGAEENSIELMSRLAVVGAELLSRTLTEIGSIVPIPQEHSAASLAPILKKSDGEADWSMTAEDLANRVRGFQPFPGVFTFFRGKRLKITKARVAEAEGEVPSLEPGAIAKLSTGIGIICGDGKLLELREVQPEGKQRMTGEAFFNGAHPSVGERLGRTDV